MNVAGKLAGMTGAGVESPVDHRRRGVSGPWGQVVTQVSGGCNRCLPHGTEADVTSGDNLLALLSRLWLPMRSKRCGVYHRLADVGSCHVGIVRFCVTSLACP